jgi:hypothetical protein
MERFFNTEGPVNPVKHYTIPLASRLDLDEILNLIRREKYFLLHAPRQTGKTSALLALMDMLNTSGDYKTLYVNVESAQAAREGCLIIFDKTPGLKWEEKLYTDVISYQGEKIPVWGM